ncbi:MAG: hypothetical protein HWE10_09615 [Gammaproteobacteria bacterium]|nr:hypothetical protein [Gammaproteobacteria bacterium]
MSASSSGTSQFFIPDSRLTFINKVMAGVQAKKIVALEGPEGIGKTALIEEVLTTALPDANKCYITVTPSMNDIQVRSRIIEQLFGNVLFDPEMPLLTSFIEFNQPSEILIAIDNCHYLSGRLIGELLQLFSESEILGINLSMVLAFNRSESSTLLNVNSGFLQIMKVPALNKQESYQLMAEYIPDLPAQANVKVKRWIENAAGIPIQLLAFNENSTLENTDGSPLNLKFWGALLVMASLLLTLVIYIYRLNVTPEPVKQELKPAQSEDLLTQQVVKPWKKNNSASEQTGSAEQALKDQQNDSGKEGQTQQPFSLDEKPMAQMIATPTASSEVIFDALMNQTQADKVTSKSTPQDVVQNPTTDMILAELTAEKAKRDQKMAEQEKSANAELVAGVAADNSTDENQNINIKGAPAPKSDDAISQTEDSMLDFFLEPEDKTSVSQEPVAKTEPELDDAGALISTAGISATPTETRFKLPSGIQYQIDNQQFMALPATHYVLQLTAVSSQEVLAEYLQSAPVSADKLRIYKVRRNQTDWIVVTHGLFETIEQARAEAKRIAPKSWAKSISVIQQQIAAYQKTLTSQ